jgi:hypothetical protein
MSYYYYGYNPYTTTPRSFPTVLEALASESLPGRGGRLFARPDVLGHAVYGEV